MYTEEELRERLKNKDNRLILNKIISKLCSLDIADFELIAENKKNIEDFKLEENDIINKKDNE